jgi:type IV secretory pathway VirB4 component
MFSFFLISSLIFMLGILLLWGIHFHNLFRYKFFRLNLAKDTFIFKDVINDNLLLDINDNYSLVLKIKPFDHKTKTSNQQKDFFKKCESFYKEIAEFEIVTRLFCIRNKKIIKHDIKEKSNLPKLNKLICENFSEHYDNDYYLQATYNKSKQKHIYIHLIKIIRNIFSDSEILSGKNLINFGYYQYNSFTFKEKNRTSFDFSPSAEVFFDYENGNTQIKTKKNIFIKTLVIHQIEKQVELDFLSEILKLNAQININVLFIGESKLSSLSPQALSHQSKQAKFSINGKRKFDDYQKVIEDIKNDKYKLYKTQFSINIQSESLDSIDDVIIKIEKIAYKKGFSLKHTWSLIQALYLSNLPGHDYLIYPLQITSMNLQLLFNFIKDDIGQIKSSWGDKPLGWFKTINDSNYAFSFHINETKNSLAHSLILGMSGSGKTTLMQYLAMGAVDLNVNTYIFDRLSGCKIFCEALKGQYIEFNKQINPLVALQKNTPNNQDSLAHFLQIMMNKDDSQSLSEIHKIVDLIYTIPVKHRVLNRIINLVVSKEYKEYFAPFVSGIYSSWFNGVLNNNAYDALYDSLDNNSLWAFDMTKVTDMPKVAKCLTFYLINMIRQKSILGNPHLVMIDEARAQLQDPVFCNKVGEMFLEHRKLNGAISVAFQDLNSLMKSPISNIIVEQCQTKILFPNPELSSQNLNVLNLTEFEKDYLSNKTNINFEYKHTVLLKKGATSVILDVNLNFLKDYLSFFSSNSQDVLLQKKLKEKYGTNWSSNYLIYKKAS